MYDMMRLTESEMDLMKMLWKNKGAMTTGGLGFMTGKCKSYARTLLKRLTERNIIKNIQADGANLYIPYVSEQIFQCLLLTNILNSFFNGSYGDMVVTLLSNDDMTLSDMAEVKLMVEKMDAMKRRQGLYPDEETTAASRPKPNHAAGYQAYYADRDGIGEDAAASAEARSAAFYINMTDSALCTNSARRGGLAADGANAYEITFSRSSIGKVIDFFPRRIKRIPKPHAPPGAMAQ